MKSYLKIALFSLIFLTINITKVFPITESIRFNMAASDALILFAFFVMLTDSFREKSLKVFKAWPIWCALVIWIILSGSNAILSPQIIDSGWKGILEELVKTGLCIVYFFVGYHTFKEIEYTKFKKLWVISAVIFVFGGIAIFILAKTGQFFWSDDPKYMRLFMGTDTDPNHAASFLTLTFFAMGIFAITDAKKVYRLVYLLSLSLAVFGVVLTGSRGGLIGLIGGISILVIYYTIKNWRFSVVLLSIILLAAIIFIQVDVKSFEGYFTQRILSKTINYQDGLETRWSLGYTALQMGNDHAIMGVGRGNYMLNSKPYFEKNGWDYVENIPHNTYWGIYSEVGIVGVVLFFAPLILLIKSIYQRYKNKSDLVKTDFEPLIWLFAAIFAIGIQSMVLNVENRRFLWYLAGLLIYFFESKKVFTNGKFESHGFNMRNNIHIILPLATLFIYVIMSFNIFLPTKNKVINFDTQDNVNYLIPRNSYKVGEENQVGINVTLTTNEERTERIQVIIAETRVDGSQSILNAQALKGIRGQIFMDFTPSMQTESVELLFVKIDPSLEMFYFKPICVLNENQVYQLDQWHFLQPKMISDIFLQSKSISLKEYYPSTELTQGLNQAFGEQFTIENVESSYIDKLSDSGELLKFTAIDVTIQNKSQIDEDYLMLILGYPFDLNQHSENVAIAGYEVYNTTEATNTSEWGEGDRHTVRFLIPRQDGIYRLRMGIRTKIDDKWTHLYVNEGKTNESIYLELGWLNLMDLE